MALAEELVYWAKEMERRSLVHGTAGNLSVYDDSAGIVWTTPTSLPYQDMTVDDVVGLDPETGERIVGRRLPTSEVPMHLSIYKALSDVRAIVHTHSLYATMFAVANRPIPAGHYIILDIGTQVPVAPYARFGSEALARNAVEQLRTARGTLLQNHGVVTIGNNLAAAFRRAETIEWLAHLMWGAIQLGPVTELSPAQLQEVAKGAREVSQRYPRQI
jgi:L-fuculose-phosphate aldolase